MDSHMVTAREEDLQSEQIQEVRGEREDKGL